jgi:ElaB/YqjD/DUF883 family membrane-anchored ribosome-binding protein
MSKSMRIEETPNFDTYPGSESPPTNTAAYVPAGQSAGAANDTRMTRAAEQIGGVVGRAVSAARDMPQKIGGELCSRFQVISGEARQRGGHGLEQVKSAAGERLDKVKNVAGHKVNQLSARATEKIQLARNRAERVARERPVEVILAGLGAGLLLGAALRIWRSNRE